MPTQFSEATMEVLTSGSMSKSARREIVQMTASKMLNYCKYPTSQQYNEVGRKIVNHLLQGKKDTSGSGYVSAHNESKYTVIMHFICRGHGQKHWKPVFGMLGVNHVLIPLGLNLFPQQRRRRYTREIILTTHFPDHY